jgi:hypothetical protein
MKYGLSGAPETGTRFNMIGYDPECIVAEALFTAVHFEYPVASAERLIEVEGFRVPLLAL